MSDFKNTLYYGDNIEILKLLSKENPKGFVDLVYIDPPFNSNRNYNMLFQDLIANKEGDKKHTALKEAFSDTWSNIDLTSELEEMKGYTDKPLIYQFLSRNKDVFTLSQMSYLTMMAHRIYYIHKLLKDSGSFYLHCDSTMSHYIKILLDIIFGGKNFRNEIIWKRTSNPKGSQFKEKKFGIYTDTIFLYSKTDNYYFEINKVKRGLSDDELEKKYPHHDEKGRYFQSPIICWGLKMRPTLVYEYNGWTPQSGSSWSMKKEVLENLDKNGDLGWNSKGNPFKKLRMDNDKGEPIGNLWTDINRLYSSNEALGYPTQKPISLLKRIILASCPPNGIVADFFCGCGTTITAAEELGVKWLGVDINHLAISLVEEKRIKPLGSDYCVIGIPQDLASAEKLANDNKFSFEEWIVEYVFKGHKTKKTGDGGIDGHITYTDMEKKKYQAIIEVKGGNVNINQIRAFKDSITKFNTEFGIFVAFGKYITDGMRREANDLGEVQMGIYAIKKMTIITIEDIFANNLPDAIKHLNKNITY